MGPVNGYICGLQGRPASGRRVPYCKTHAFNLLSWGLPAGMKEPSLPTPLGGVHISYPLRPDQEASSREEPGP